MGFVSCENGERNFETLIVFSDSAVSLLFSEVECERSI